MSINSCYALYSNQSLYLNRFRAHTFSEVYIGNYNGEIKTSELVDRLYLWVWSWLLKPESDRLERIMKTLNDIIIKIEFNIEFIFTYINHYLEILIEYTMS